MAIAIRPCCTKENQLIQVVWRKDAIEYAKAGDRRSFSVRALN
jgi:hypothetical protein